MILTWDELPKEIQDKMLERQEQQIGVKNSESFKKSLSTCNGTGGFHWRKSKEGHKFWSKIAYHRETDHFYEMYPKVEDEPIKTTSECVFDKKKILEQNDRNLYLKVEGKEETKHLLIKETQFKNHFATINLQDREIVISLIPSPDTESVLVGHSLCNPKDTFNLELGQKISKGRALKESSRLFNISDISSKYMKNDDVMQFLLNRVVKGITKNPHDFIKSLSRFV